MTSPRQSLETSKPSKTHWLITMYAGGGEFCDGYILSIIGVALPLLTGAFHLSGTTAGILGSATLVGMFFGGLIFGYVTDHIGRQKVYLADIAAFIVLSALQFFATDPWQLTALRFLMGIAIGADFAIAATIASEFATQKSRGPLLVVLVTMWSLGAATAYVEGWAMLSLGDDAWRWMLASSAIPAALILLLRIGTPESPRWLLSKGRTDEAREVLTKMLGPHADLSDVEADSGSRTRYSDIFRGPYLKRTIFICVFWACQLAADLRDHHLPADDPAFARSRREQRVLPRRGHHPDLFRPRLTFRCAGHQQGSPQAAAVEFRHRIRPTVPCSEYSGTRQPGW
jgi:putative MFS transporter